MSRYPRRLTPLLCRGFATKYTGKAVTITKNGRLSAIEVSVSSSLISDVRGYALPRRDLICRATKILLSSSSPDPFGDLIEYHQTLNVNPTTSEVSEILKSLKSPTLALQLFHHSSTRIPKFRHDAFTYNHILTILSKSALPEKIDKMKEVLNLMERLGASGNISTVIRAFDGVDGLKRCFDLLKKWGLSLICQE